MCRCSLKVRSEEVTSMWLKGRKGVAKEMFEKGQQQVQRPCGRENLKKVNVTNTKRARGGC